jgi:hypothetical protein
MSNLFENYQKDFARKGWNVAGANLVNFSGIFFIDFSKSVFFGKVMGCDKETDFF